MHQAVQHNLELETEASSTPRNSTYNYNPITGVQYANKYVKNNNTAFHYFTSGGNCTNFVSQCIWAAYGGWSSSDSHNTIVNNIAARRRMMPSTTLSNWFGHGNGAGNPWSSTTNLWNFVTGNPAVGPKATGSNNNAVYTGVSPAVINQGNVLQFRNGSSGSYSHSVYVINTIPIHVLPPAYGNITVAQNTPDTTRLLSESINGFGGSNCHMRRLAFTSAVFSS
ncbi:MAG: amidase domain-containing protein [Oscillospiraceae bacterium]|jgi:hypothetical protein|nr:amidase domain-containing protein [Oscillospiraceae bacterium]